MSSRLSPSPSSSSSIIPQQTTKPKPQHFSSLSRNALYATLNSYIKTQNNDTGTTPGNAKKEQTKNNLSNAVREKSLYSFLEKVSIEYHSSTSPLGRLGGTNGGQPLKSRHLETKIAQRALTLIGGGCSNSFTKSTNEDGSADAVVIGGGGGGKKRKAKGFDRVHNSVSNKKRKRIIRSNVENNNNMMRNNNENKSKERCKSEKDYTKPTLLGLNSIWNKYMNVLLGQVVDSKRDYIQNDKIASLVSTAELIGAHVIIQSNKNPMSRKIGKAGIIVDVTKNVWRIALPVNKMTFEKIDDVPNDAQWKVLLVPKSISSLICVIQKHFKSSNEVSIEKIHVKLTC